MGAVKFLLGFFCFVAVCGSRLPDGNLLKLAEAEVGVREGTGRNDGVRVEEYLRCVGLRAGAPWCAAYVSFVFWEAGFAGPRTAWSPALFPAQRLVKKVMPGVVYGLYFPSLKRIGHCGIVLGARGDYVIGVEGNTDPSGGREGDGVYRRLRHRRTISAYADWVSN